MAEEAPMLLIGESLQDGNGNFSTHAALFPQRAATNMSQRLDLRSETDIARPLNHGIGADHSLFIYDDGAQSGVDHDSGR